MRAASLVSLVLLNTAVFSADASAQAPSGSRSCAPAELLPIWTSRGPVFRSCDVDQPATTDYLRYTFNPPRSDQCYNATIAFVVDAEGAVEPGSSHVLYTSHSVFSQAMLNSIRSLTFRPALKDGRPVRQVVVREFAVSGSSRAGSCRR